jgi:NAD(P)-dependent dehydrogenase (short-subunit alcohol dehydrogenase family)
MVSGPRNVTVTGTATAISRTSYRSGKLTFGLAKKLVCTMDVCLDRDALYRYTKCIVTPGGERRDNLSQVPQACSQVVAVIGATSGIGRATAIRCARSGRRVVLVGRRAEMLDDLVKAVLSRPSPAGLEEPVDEPLPLSLDMRAPEAAEKVLASSLSHFGRLDVVVYAAGWNVPKRALGEVTDESWRTVLDTNLTGAFNLTNAVVPAMRGQGGGLLVYISSSAALRADRSGVAYQASKAGLAALAQATTEECRDDNIRATVIYPGLTDTPFMAHRPTALPEEARRLALQPDDVAAACMFVIDLPSRAHVPQLVISPSRQL